MAKKKQLAGKQTKLAKLPLTRALAQKAEEAAPWKPSAVPGEAPRQPALAAGGPAEGLLNAYLQIVEDLSILQNHFFLPSPAGAPAPQVRLPQPLPQARVFKAALHLARQGLRDLQRFLSQ